MSPGQRVRLILSLGVLNLVLATIALGIGGVELQQQAEASRRPADIAAVIRNGRKDDTKRYPQYIREKDGYMNMPPFTDLSISGSELETLVTYLKGPFQQGKFNRP